MKKTHPLVFAPVGLLCLLLAGNSLADDMLPPAVESGAVTYINGGIGKTESDAMRKAAPRYPLALMMSESADGHYVAGVQLRVLARDGRKLLEHPSAGPLVLLQLPSGRYRVEAQHEGRTLARDVQVRSGGHAMVHLNWPAT